MTINTVSLMGRLTSNPELRRTSGGTAVADLTLAVNRYYQDAQGNSKEETSFIPVTVWGSQAENCSEYLSKGSQAAVVGRLKMDEWTNDAGESRSKLKVVAKSVTFLDSDGAGGQSSNNSQSSQKVEEDSNIPF